MRIVVVLALCVAFVRPSDACAPAPPRGEEVRIAEEEALIIWDPDTKTEQFIRRAAFRSTSRQFGFLVPTPTKPELTEFDDGVFDRLAEVIRPPAVYDRSDRNYKLGSFFLDSCVMMAAKSDDARGRPAVRVLQTANVAGFEATTVEADDARALTDWLAAHNFETTPQLTAWLERYVTDHWKITAFVVATNDDKRDRFDIATRAVNMTFHTDRPFYPYREPKIEMTVESTAKLAPVADRMLRVYFVSNERYAATLADQPWSAKTLQAGRFGAYFYDNDQLLHGRNYLTAFVDNSSPRRGIEELYFARSADQSPVEQAPQVVKWPEDVTIPVDLIVIGGLLAIWIVRKLRR